jgi:ABC-type nitrate/sulfonate/bicarbonate transport system permease component
MNARLRDNAALWAVVGALALGGFWEAFVRIRHVRKFVLLPPSEIVSTFFETPSYYLENIWVTGQRLAVGLVISLAIALAIGALLAAFRPLEHASQPFLVLVLVTPWVAYISSIVLWVGRGTPSILFLVVFVTVPAFVYATVGGMRGADPAARELFASVDASRGEVLWRLRLPSAMPSIFTAARFNVGLGLAAAYFAEGAALSTNGLGEAGKRAAALNVGPILWTTILCTALLGIAAQAVVRLAERWLLRWHVSQRRPAR